MTLKRRLIISLPSVVTVAALSNSCAAHADEADYLEKWGFRDPDADDATAGVGTGAPDPDEWFNAFRLHFGAPRGGNPVDVARYYEGIGKQNVKPYVNKDGENYAAEWKIRANPLIIGFWLTTRSLPAKGDVTAWCAAFVDFCLMLSNRPVKKSGSSADFRLYGDSVQDPKVGDLVVFADKSDNKHGHVGFFISETKDSVTVLGGNQSKNTNTTGKVTEYPFSKKGESLKLLGYRRIPEAI